LFVNAAVTSLSSNSDITRLAAYVGEYK